jgi:hypothetical protein
MKIAVILCFASSLLLFGCATYKYNGVSYATRKAALAAAHSQSDAATASVRASTNRVGGTLAIVIPTRDVISQYGVRKGPATGESQVEYVVDVLEYGFLSRARTVAAAKVFDKTNGI